MGPDDAPSLVIREEAPSSSPCDEWLRRSWLPDSQRPILAADLRAATPRGADLPDEATCWRLVEDNRRLAAARSPGAELGTLAVHVGTLEDLQAFDVEERRELAEDALADAVELLAADRMEPIATTPIRAQDGTGEAGHEGTILAWQVLVGPRASS